MDELKSSPIVEVSAQVKAPLSVRKEQGWWGAGEIRDVVVGSKVQAAQDVRVGVLVVVLAWI